VVYASFDPVPRSWRAVCVFEGPPVSGHEAAPIADISLFLLKAIIAVFRRETNRELPGHDDLIVVNGNPRGAETTKLKLRACFITVESRRDRSGVIIPPGRPKP